MRGGSNLWLFMLCASCYELSADDVWIVNRCACKCIFLPLADVL